MYKLIPISIDLDKQNTTDDLVIDYPKIDLLKSYSGVIYDLFKTSIEFGDIVKTSAKDQTKDMKVWINLFGSSNERKKAKKYISSICNPEYVKKIKLNEKLLKLLNTNNYKNKLITDYQTNLEISKNELIIQGSLSDVSEVKCLIDLELNKSNQNNAKLDDDDVILINDPYEVFENEQFKEKKKPNKDSKLSSDKSSLIKLALSKGFSQNEIDRALKELSDTSFGEIEFIEYLKLTTSLSKKSSKQEKMSEEMDDCEIIAFIPKKGNLEANKALNEYAEMFKTQEFDKENEKLNKLKRINTLISGMPDEQKANAINHFNKINKNSSKSLTNDNLKLGTNQSAPYNPAMYQDEQFDSNLDYIFSNFSAGSKNLLNENKSESNIKNKNNNSKNKRNRNNYHRSNERNSNAHTRSKSINPKIDTENKNSQAPFNNYNNNYNRKASISESSNLKFIVIDGSNVAREHGKEMGKIFSCKGLKIVVDFFLKRGHTQIKAFVPKFRRGTLDIDCPTKNPEILDELEEKGYLTYTPSRYVNNRLILPYDDRFILKAAHHYDAIIVSNDNYRDLMKENVEWKRLIETNLLQFSFVGDLFIVADDPLGRRGPHLDQFLSKTFNNNMSKNIKKNSSNPAVSNLNFSDSQNEASGFKMFDVSNELSNASNSNKKQPRSSAESSKLYRDLIEIFPNMNKNINNLLDKYKYEKNLNFFATKLMESSN